MVNETRQPETQTGPESLTPPPGAESPLKLLWRRKGVILGCIAAALGAAALYLSLTPPKYLSQAQLHVQRRGDPLEETTASTSHPANFLPTQCQLMGSSLILRKAMDEAHLEQTDTLRQAPDPIEKLKKILNVELGRRHDIISASVTCEEPDEAARIANAVVEAYVRHQKQESTQTLQTLKDQRDIRQRELEDKIRQMVDFQVTHGESQFETDEDNVVIRRLGQITEALTRAELELVDARYRAKLAEEAADDPARLAELVNASRDGPSIHEASRLYREEQDLILAENRLRDMRRHYTQDHPALRSCEQDVEKIQEKIRRIRREHEQAYIEAAQERFEVAKQKLNELQQSFSQQQEKILQLNTLGAQFALLQTDADRTRSHVDVLDARIKQLSLATEAAGTIRYEILEEAMPSTNPVSPDARRIVTLSLLVGVLLGCGLALMLEWTDSRLRTPAQVTREIRHPVLVNVPKVAGRSHPEILGQKARLDGSGAMAETMRILNTSLHFSCSKGKYKSVLITSAEPGEGKSTVASNLAITMAQCGKRVLLLDADLYRPMQHLTFRVNPAATEPVATEGKIPPLEKLLIRPTQIRGLDVLPGGPLLEAAMDVLGDQGFEYLLKRLGKSYDRIVVDAPPLLHLAEGRSLAATCDATLLVVRADRSQRDSTQQAHQTLHEVGANFVGMVLNRVKPSRNYRYRSNAPRSGGRKRVKLPFRVDNTSRIA
jgi:capsular exopolysaccharide synthesis family protein